MNLIWLKYERFVNNLMEILSACLFCKFWGKIIEKGRKVWYTEIYL